VNDVKTLALQLQLDRFHILGVSGGGVFALACAALMPENLISVTIVSCPAPINFPSFWVGISRTNKAAFIVSSRYPKWLSLMCSILSVVKKNRTKTKTHDGEAFLQGGIGLKTDLLILSKNWNIPLEKISIPVYMWHGECDVLASAVAAKELAKIIPSCESYFIANEGHFIGRNPTASERVLERILRNS
jgi:pimeloyl-ACP methyl ester carboxylesterase